MKRATKLSVLLVVAAAAIAVTFTGCPDLGFGKDDLYGTWKTLDFDANGNPVDRYTTSDGTYSVTWKFDGNSENMFNGTGGTFKQHLVKYSSSGGVEAETFWYGEYAIKGNSGYSKGKLYLYYECGYNMRGTGASASLDELWDWSLDNYIGASGFSGIDAMSAGSPITVEGIQCYHNNNNPVYIQVKKDSNGDIKCSDIEYFRFNLKDGSLYGYTRLMTSTTAPNGNAIGGIYSQWGEAATTTVTSSNAHFAGGNKIANSCSWKGTSIRYMGRISARSTPDEPIWMCSSTTPNSEYFNGVDVGDDNDYADPDAEMRPEQ